MSNDKGVATSAAPLSVGPPSGSRAMQQVPPGISPRTGRPKRRKAVRACVHCQRTHLTCDNNRPCERCVARGLAETCCDGSRKKAKYLKDDDASSSKDSLSVGRSAGTLQSDHLQHALPGSDAERLLQQPYGYGPAHVLEPVAAKDERSFQSAATDLEYATLSAILHGNNRVAPSPPFVGTLGASLGPSAPETALGTYDHFGQYTLDSVNINDLMLGYEDNSPLSDWLETRPPPISITVNEPESTPATATPIPRVTAPADIYRTVCRPYPYTRGFHALLKYLKQRFPKPDLMQIVRSMAKYRPTFISCSNTLTEDDFVFLEQCFQRSLLEYEKYLTYWGTPTVIWRRTGHIAAVGAEFCMLTGWQMGDLLETGEPAGGGGRFIVELMDNASVINYFKIFSDMSFGDSRGAVMTDCTLVTPSGKPIRTSSVLTLKRDLFGIPMLIIGNFLPVLTKN